MVPKMQSGICETNRLASMRLTADHWSRGVASGLAICAMQP